MSFTPKLRVITSTSSKEDINAPKTKRSSIVDVIAKININPKSSSTDLSIHELENGKKVKTTERIYTG